MEVLMKRICFIFFVSFCVFYSCSKNGNWKEFKVEYEEKTETFKKDNIEGKYSLSYPYFKDYPEFNEIVEEKVKEEKEYITKAEDLLEYDLSFGEIRTSGDYIGFMFNVSTYFLGDAHPSVLVFSVNYNSKTKKQATLKDVFAPLSKDYLKVFSDFSYKELTSRVEKVKTSLKKEPQQIKRTLVVLILKEAK